MVSIKIGTPTKYKNVNWREVKEFLDDGNSVSSASDKFSIPIGIIYADIRRRYGFKYFSERAKLDVDWDNVKTMLDSGVWIKDIGKQVGITSSTIRKYIKRLYGDEYFRNIKNHYHTKTAHVNWDEIKQILDTMKKSPKEIAEEYNVVEATIRNNIKKRFGPDYFKNRSPDSYKKAKGEKYPPSPMRKVNDEEVLKIYNNGKSLLGIACKMGVSQTIIRDSLIRSEKKLGMRIRRKRGSSSGGRVIDIEKAVNMYNSGGTLASVGEAFGFTAGAMRYRFKQYENETGEKVLIGRKNNGIELIRIKDGYPTVLYRENAHGRVPIHKIKVENYIGRKLVSGEQVHHCDENKMNWKDIKNLVIVSSQEHQQITSLQMSIKVLKALKKDIPNSITNTIEELHNIYRQRMVQKREQSVINGAFQKLHEKILKQLES